MASSIVPDDKPYTMVVAVSENEMEYIKEKAMTMNGKVNLFTEDLGFPVLTRTTPKTKNKNLPIFYTINNKAGIQAQMGDDVESICARADFDVEKFVKYNDLSEGSDTKITPNEVYYLEKKDKKAPVPFHTITNATQQSLWKVSQMYGICLDKLLKFNHLDSPQRLVDGRVLWLSKTRPSNSPVEVINIPVAKPILLKKVETLQVSKTVSQATEGVKIVDLTLSETPTEVFIASEPSTQEEREQLNASTNQEFRPNLPVQIHQVKDYTHIVTNGENYFSIARKYNISVNDLWIWNRLTKANKLGIGKKLIIKFGHYYVPNNSMLAHRNK